MADVSSTLTSLYSSSSLLGASSSALNQSANGSGSSSRSASATTPAGSSYCSWVCTSANSSATESTTTAGSASILADPYANFYIGVILGILQTVLNGFSFLFNKKAQQRLIARGYAATNSIRYLCDWMWWLAMVLCTPPHTLYCTRMK